HIEPDGMLTVSEVAEALNIHVNTVRAWSNDGTLPAHRIGKRGDRRFLVKDIYRFLDRGRLLEVAIGALPLCGFLLFELKA
ncbi:MAG: helix-turn-helix domain-containing protein, partial [Chloroflexota bacterium]